MPIKHFRPLTPSQRFTSLNKPVGLSKERPVRGLTENKNRSGGRNVYGRVTSRRIGGGHKQLYRIIDFKRDILDIPAKVAAIEYDPNRTAHIALLYYTNGTSVTYRPRRASRWETRSWPRMRRRRTTSPSATISRSQSSPRPPASTAWRWSPARAPRWAARPAPALSSSLSSTATRTSRCPPGKSAW